MDPSDRDAHLRFIELAFFHGTGRKDLAFRPGRVAYLTSDRELARDRAALAAEAAGGEPIVLTARLRVRNPIVVAGPSIRDLHLRPDLVAEYRALGHDCALGTGPRPEVAVFDGADGVEVVEVERVADRDASSPTLP